MKFLREPLVQFLLIGAALFVIFGWVGRSIDETGTAQIRLSAAKIDELVTGFKLDFKKSPTLEEIDKLIDDYIREQVLCEEAWRLKLDRDDRVIRTRLRQRMEFFHEDNAQIAMPGDAELEAVLQKNADAFRKPDGSLPALKEVRERVQRTWLADQRKRASEEAYQKLKSKYKITIERPVRATSATIPTTEPK